MEELALRIDAGLLALLDNEVAIERRRQAEEASKVGANPKKKTRTQVVRDILVEGLRIRAEARGEEFPLIEPVGKARPLRGSEPVEVVPVPTEQEQATIVRVVDVMIPELKFELAIVGGGTPRPSTPLRRIGVTRRPDDKK